MYKIQQLVWTGLLLVSNNLVLSIEPSTANTPPLPTSAISDRVYDVKGQDPKYPLKTRVSPDVEQQFSKFFVFTKADKTQIIKLRSILQPLADRSDPIALFWLAKTYDLYEFGIGDDKDAIVALKYYTKAADLGMATAEYFLADVYRYSLMGLVKDERKVISYLDRAKLHGNNSIKAAILLHYARWYSKTLEPRTDFKFIPPSESKMLEALQSAYALDPNDTTIADWWGGELDERHQYTTALEIYRRSENPHTHQRIGEMYETGKGTSIDLPMAISWYKRSAKEQIKGDYISTLPYYYRSASVDHLYRLICQQKISPADARPYFRQPEYESFLEESRLHQRSDNLKTNPCIPKPGG
jgi:Sel1 repeat